MTLEQQIKKLANKKPHEMTEADWSAKWDAEHLASAERIKNDSPRLKKAKLWAAALLLQSKEEDEAFKKIANS